MAKQYWLMKTEPDVFSIDMLKKDGKTPWEGVRNYAARNFMAKQMKVGEGILYYHSSCEVPGVAGLAEVASKPYPDKTQFNPKSDYYDPKATPEAPRWMHVDVAFKKKAKEVIPGKLLKEIPGLQKMVLFRIGRLSISPVTATEWKIITGMKGFW